MSAHRSSKGKERAREGDYAQSFASLSLNDDGDHVLPPSDSNESSYPDVYGSSYEQPYTSDSHYGWVAQSSQSPSAAYSGAPGYSTPYPTTSATSSTGRYEYRSEPSSTSNCGSYAGYDTVSAASSAPSAPSNRVDINNTINRQRPPNERYQLPCEFCILTGCDRVFTGDDEQGWIDHAEWHLQGTFPLKLRCWFCSDQRFDANETSKGNVLSNFQMRMQHIRDHFIYDGSRRDQMMKDGYLVQHLLDHNIIDRRTYECILNPTTVPPIPTGHNNRGRHIYNRRHPGHRRLPQVEEEVFAESSSRQHHRSEHKSENNRDHSVYGHKHRSKRGRPNRESDSKLYPTPPPDSLNESVSQTARQDWSLLHSSSISQASVQDRSSLYSSSISQASVQDRSSLYSSSISQASVRDWSSLDSSSIMSENTSVAGSIISSRKPASRHPVSKHSGDQNIPHAGDEIATDTAVNELHKVDSGRVGETRSDSPGRVESLQSDDHSNVGLSSYSTHASTPESGSFWLAEYSEDEESRLDFDHPFYWSIDLAVARVFEAFHSWRESCSEQDLPCDGAEESNPTPKKDQGKGKDSDTGKRKWADQSENNKNKDNSNEPSTNRVGRSKRRRTSDRQLTFACPYTKKDPMSYRDCYKYKLSRIRDVKQHLARCHRNPPYCPRCRDTFKTEERRDVHVRESSCPLRPATRLNGITESQKSQLAKKSASNTSAEAQWFAVFDIVFPEHKPRPLSPYIDSELLQDITVYHDFLTSHGPRILSRLLDEQGIVTWHLPNEERDLAAFQQEVFEEGLRQIFDEWLARRSSSSQDPNLTSSSGSTGQNTPPSSSNTGERVGSTSVPTSRAVPPESSGSRPAETHLQVDSGDTQGVSSEQISFEVPEGSFDLDHEFLSEFPYDDDNDDLTQLFKDP